MKICIFSRSFWPNVGGVESLGHLLARTLFNLGHSVWVVTDTVGSADAPSGGYRIVRAEGLAGRQKAFSTADVVLMMNVSLPGLAAAVLAGVPVVLSHHGVHKGRGAKGKIAEFVKRQLTRLFRNISVSRFVATQLPKSSVVIGNAYDDTLFKQPIPATRSRDFVFCGRLVSEKGADMCIRAFAEVIRTGIESTLTIVGEGPERGTLENLAKSLNVSEHVVFHGSLQGEALVRALQAHLCMVIPSRCEEGFGIVALEGLACCDAVIATRRGGLPEAVGDYGIVANAEDGALAAAMRNVVLARPYLINADPRARLARDEHLRLHSPERVAEQYVAVLHAAGRFK